MFRIYSELSQLSVFVRTFVLFRVKSLENVHNGVSTPTFGSTFFFFKVERIKLRNETFKGLKENSEFQLELRIWVEFYWRLKNCDLKSGRESFTFQKRMRVFNTTEVSCTCLWNLFHVPVGRGGIPLTSQRIMVAKNFAVRGTFECRSHRRLMAGIPLHVMNEKM